MTDIRVSDFGGIPYGSNSGRPSNPGLGRLYSNGESSRLELYTNTGWQNIVQETPGIVSIAGTYNQSAASSSITINGTNFQAGAIAYAVGSNGVDYAADSTVLNSIVNITAVFSGLDPANEPFDIKVVNPSNLYGVLNDVLYINDSPIWTTSSGSLGTYTEGTSVNIGLSATDDESQALTFSLVSGTLPSGLTLNTSTGVISGTAPLLSSDTTYSFVISVSDGSNTISRSFSITINGNPPVWSTSQTLPSYTRNSAYTTTISATDDSGIVSYSIISGSLPSGMTLNSSTGVITGTTTSYTPATFTVRATDNNYGYADRTFTLPNTGPVWSTASQTFSVDQNASFSQTLVATDDSGIAPTYSIVSGTLPTGLSFNTTSGVVSGTPTVSGSSTVTFGAADTNNTITQRSFTFLVVATNTWSVVNSNTGVTTAEPYYGIYDGFLYTGKGQYAGTYGTTFWKVNLSDGTSTQMAAGPTRDEVGSCWIGSKFYVPGGAVNNSNQQQTLWMYDAVANSWTQLANAPVLFYNSGCGTDGTDLYVLASSSPNTFLKYTVSNNTWTTLVSGTGDLSQSFCSKLWYYNGNFYTHKYDSNASVQKYRAWQISTGGTITKLAVPTDAASYYNPDNYSYGWEISTSTGNIYLYAYQAGTATAGTKDLYAWKYNISGNSWTKLGSSTAISRTAGAYCTDSLGFQYVLGGYTGSSSYTTSLDKIKLA